uniref:Zn(2)-C6 fungal-type domain-containing protein n=1 Tax=Bionectria ochroleuca TaxID=29856 RepID=A0A8H7K138_BIOOC
MSFNSRTSTRCIKQGNIKLLILKSATGDGALPCSQCAKRKLSCNKGSKARFRLMSQGSKKFPSDQTWCRTISKRIDFVDQSLEIARQYDGGSEAEDEDFPADRFNEHADTSPPNTEACDPNSRLSPAANSLSIEDQIISQISPQTGSDIGQSPLIRDWTQAASECSIESTIRQFKRLELPQAALKEKDKSDLIRHFVQVVGPAFDFYDEGRKVASEVTERALSCQPLLHLVYNASARSLGLSLDLENAPQSLGNPITLPHIDDGNNNAAAALLSRFIFNLEDKQDSTQGFAIVSIPSSPLYNHAEFQAAIMWASLRQEIFLALMNQRHVNIPVDRHALESLPQDHLSQTADDSTWCNRMLLHLFDTIQYCFGDAHSSSTYDQLFSYANTWMSSKPSSFTPVFSQDGPNGQMLPEIWFLDSCAAAGMQYYHLVRILLTAHNPRVPRIGSAKKAAIEWIDEQVRGHAKMVCGIAESLEEINPGHLSACMAIALAGDYFHEKEEQAILLNLMIKTSSYYGWSTGSTQKYLQETWKI